MFIHVFLFQIVCTQMSCGMVIAAPGNAFFGRNDTLPILLDDVHCKGGELVLFDCNHAGVGIHNCNPDHREDASVIVCIGSKC